MRIYRHGPKPANLPWWVWLGNSTRYGGQFTRRWAILNAWMTTLIAPIALVVSFYRDEPWRYLVLFFAVGVVPFAVWRWLAIRWLDKRKAWNLARERLTRVR